MQDNTVKYILTDRRYLARLLDQVITGAASFIILITFLELFPDDFLYFDILVFLIFITVLFVGITFNNILLPYVFHGSSIGKFVLRVKIVDKTGHTPGLMSLVIREIVFQVILNFGFIGILLLGLTVKDNQYLHDKAAGT